MPDNGLTQRSAKPTEGSPNTKRAEKAAEVAAERHQRTRPQLNPPQFFRRIGAHHLPLGSGDISFDILGIAQNAKPPELTLNSVVYAPLGEGSRRTNPSDTAAPPNPTTKLPLPSDAVVAADAKAIASRVNPDHTVMDGGKYGPVTTSARLAYLDSGVAYAPRPMPQGCN